jgi:GTPase SAR1 family protein
MGKTCLCSVLQGGPFNPKHDSTKGIDVSPWKLPTEALQQHLESLPAGRELPGQWRDLLPNPDAGEELDVRLWDMAGQDLYAAQRQQFTGASGSFFCVLWRADRPFKEQVDTILVWVRTILSGSKDSKSGVTVFMVGTHGAQAPDGKEHRPSLVFREQMKELFSAHQTQVRWHPCVDSEPREGGREGLGISALRADLLLTMLEADVVMTMVPPAWQQLKGLVDQWREDLEGRDHKVSLDGYCSWVAQQAFTDSSGGKVTLDEASIRGSANYLHRLGYICWYEESGVLREVVYMRPEYLIEVVRAVINHTVENEVEWKTGIVLKSTLKEKWREVPNWVALVQHVSNYSEEDAFHFGPLFDTLSIPFSDKPVTRMSQEQFEGIADAIRSNDCGALKAAKVEWTDFHEKDTGPFSFDTRPPCRDGNPVLDENSDFKECLAILTEFDLAFPWTSPMQVVIPDLLPADLASQLGQDVISLRESLVAVSIVFAPEFLPMGIFGRYMCKSQAFDVTVHHLWKEGMVAKVGHDCYLELSISKHGGLTTVRVMVQSVSNDRGARDQVLVRQEAIWHALLEASFPGLEEMDMVLEQQRENEQRCHTVKPGWRDRVRKGLEIMPLNEFGELFLKQSKYISGFERFGKPLVVPEGADDGGDVPEGYRCPITATIMRQPTLCTKTGRTYDYDSIIKCGGRDPMTREAFDAATDLCPNRHLKDMIEQWLQTRADHS